MNIKDCLRNVISIYVKVETKKINKNDIGNLEAKIGVKKRGKNSFFLYWDDIVNEENGTISNKLKNN